jgi:acid phosphatase type 7
MSDLKEGTTYYYRVGDGADRWSQIFSLDTFVPSQPISYAIIADMDFESNDTINNVAQLVADKKIQAVIHSGDISYADGYEPHWDVFFRRIEPIAAYVPYMVTPGNHEFWYNFTSYKHRFYLPGEIDAGGSGDGMFYAWNAGYAHFIAGNSETPIDTANFSSAFLTWMESDLSAVNREQTPFVIVHFHRPMYCSNSDACSNKGGDRLKAQAESMFYQQHVNLVLTGHVHSYERTYPVWNDTATQFTYDAPAAPVYILQGGSGNREGNDGFPDNAPSWSAAHEASVGFGIMTVSKDSIDFSFYASRSSEEGGPLLKDHFLLTL